MRYSPDILERILAKTVLILHVVELGQCWQWTGGCSGSGRGGGYGRVSVHGVTQAVHLVAYRMMVGRIRPGRQVDHLCYNRRCWNPAHLEQVTHLTNQRRRRSG